MVMMMLVVVVVMMMMVYDGMMVNDWLLCLLITLLTDLLYKEEYMAEQQ